MSKVGCTGEPVSWLALERYHLGELDPSEKVQVDQHLGACAVCRACAERIAGAPAVELPPLAIPLGARRARLARPMVLAGAAAALAASILVFVQAPPPVELGSAVKGGELAVSIVRERAGEIAEEPAGFAPGDRFKVLLTCAPPRTETWEVAVYQHGVVSFPFTGPGRIECRNAAPLPGAFALDGTEPARVCVIAGDAIPDRASLSRVAAAGPPPGAVCKVLTPEAPQH